MTECSAYKCLDRRLNKLRTGGLVLTIPEALYLLSVSPDLEDHAPHLFLLVRSVQKFTEFLTQKWKDFIAPLLYDFPVLDDWSASLSETGIRLRAWDYYPFVSLISRYLFPVLLVVSAALLFLLHSGAAVRTFFIRRKEKAAERRARLRSSRSRRVQYTAVPEAPPGSASADPDGDLFGDAADDAVSFAGTGPSSASPDPDSGKQRRSMVFASTALVPFIRRVFRNARFFLHRMRCRYKNMTTLPGRGYMRIQTLPASRRRRECILPWGTEPFLIFETDRENEKRTGLVFGQSDTGSVFIECQTEDNTFFWRTLLPNRPYLLYRRTPDQVLYIYIVTYIPDLKL